MVCVWLHFSSTVRCKCMSAICLAVMSLPLCSVPCVAFAAFVWLSLHAFPIHGDTFGADDHDAEPHLDINGNSQECRLEDAEARIMEDDDVELQEPGEEEEGVLPPVMAMLASDAPPNRLPGVGCMIKSTIVFSFVWPLCL